MSGERFSAGGAGRQFPECDSRCPACDYGPLNTAREVGGGAKPPAPGDMLVCLRCGALLAYEAGAGGSLTVRQATEAEWQEVPPATRRAIEVHRADVRRRYRVDGRQDEN